MRGKVGSVSHSGLRRRNDGTISEQWTLIVCIQDDVTKQKCKNGHSHIGSSRRSNLIQEVSRGWEWSVIEVAYSPRGYLMLETLAHHGCNTHIHTPNELSSKTTGSKSSRKAIALPAIKTLMKNSRLYLSSNNVLIQDSDPVIYWSPKQFFACILILGKRIGRDALL